MVVEVKNLVKRYGDLLALDNFNLQLREGEILGLVGPNGSGKTTAINCILSLLNYSTGEIDVFSQKMTATSYAIKQKIGVVPQEVAVIDTLTVEENIDYFCGLYINDKSLRKQLVEEAIDFVKVDSHRKFFPHKLSGGLKRRLNIACGISHKPQLLILDEPTVAIDAQSRQFILDGIKELNQKGTTVLYTSHYLEEVEELCDRIIIMDKGSVIASGTKEELLTLLPISDIVTVEFVADEHKMQSIIQKIKALDNFFELNQEKEKLRISFKSNNATAEQFILFLRDNDLSYNKLNFDKPSLNEVFLFLTGKELRE